MTKLEELEKRIAAIEVQLDRHDGIEEVPVPDPYLVPGAPCEVWDEPGKEVCVYFSHWFIGSPLFTCRKDFVGTQAMSYANYRVLGTVWDHAPERAEWVATNLNCTQNFYLVEPYIDKTDNTSWTSHGPFWPAGEADPADWKNSLRRRPEWARRKG